MLWFGVCQRQPKWQAFVFSQVFISEITENWSMWHLDAKLRQEPHDFSALCNGCETTGWDEQRSQRKTHLSGHFTRFNQLECPFSIKRWGFVCAVSPSCLITDQNSVLTIMDRHQDVCLLMNENGWLMITTRNPAAVGALITTATLTFYSYEEKNDQDCLDYN